MIILRRFLSLLAVLACLGGCATTGYNPNDPLEGYNRAMFGFNDGVDRAFIKPLASGYKAVLPEIARTGVSNVFANLGDIWIGINNILQGKVGAGVGDLNRFLMNTTFGILGLFDVASNAGLEKHNEDFGQTLGRWGVGSGPYVVLPILGPSSVRDGFSKLFIDWHFDPIWYVGNIPARNGLVVVRFVDLRASLLDVSRLVEEAALDQYAYIRDAYLQRRRSLIYDGDPPPEPEPPPEPAPAKSSERGPGTAARSETGLPPAQITDQRGERVITGGDADITPAQEFSAATAQPFAAKDASAAPARGDESQIHDDALRVVPTQPRAGLAQNSLRP